jgi:hypothetical protein
MRLRWSSAVDMPYFVSTRYQPVGNQHAMTLEIQSLGAHICGARPIRERNQFLCRALKVGGEHIVGIVAKALVAQRDIRRMIEDLLAVAAQSLHPHITDCSVGQIRLQRILIKLRQSPRHGERTDIGQRLNLVSAQHRNQFFARARRMSDGVENAQLGFRLRNFITRCDSARPRPVHPVLQTQFANPARRVLPPLEPQPADPTHAVATPVPLRLCHRN